MVKAFKLILVAASFTSLSACVTQNYENSDTPVIQNESSNNDIAMTRISLGLGYLKMGNTTQAKLNLEKAKRFAPNLVQVYTAFAHYYETVGEDKLTIESYEKALSLKPDDADTLNNYGVFLCRQDLLPEAEIQFLRAIAVPSYLLVSKSYENLALCQLKAPNFEKAETYLSKAIDHNPTNAATLYQMMRLQYAKGEYDDALGYAKRFEKATRRFNPDSLALTYKIYTKMGNDRIAKNYGSMLVKMFPESWHAKQYLLNNLEQIDADELAEKYQLLKLGAYDKTETKRVVVLSPTNKPAMSMKPKRQSSTASKSTKKLIELTPPSEDVIAASETTKPVKKTVVLRSSKPKVKKAVQDDTNSTVVSEQDADANQSGVVEEAAEAANVTTENNDTLLVEESVKAQEETLVGSAAEAIALAKAELAAIEEQLGDEAFEVDEELNEAPVEPEFVDSLNDTTLESEESLEALEAQVAEEEAALEENTDDIIALINEEEDQAVELIDDMNVSNVDESEVSDNLEPSIDETQVSTAPIVDNETPEIADQESVYLTVESLPQHIITDGENLFTISKRYNIRMKSLRQWNELKEDSVIHVGDVIYLADPSQVVEQE
ncbi:type IV pilus biogenesis/stability protein PilW [Thalassotalea euphylliae]|uniref:type IV pilus biogenesis/stability protein PilW n=1 Tax=Thalassotalea euphylliae TaxID=1655234 RepID=UPI0036260997